SELEQANQAIWQLQQSAKSAAATTTQLEQRLVAAEEAAAAVRSQLQLQQDEETAARTLHERERTRLREHADELQQMLAAADAAAAAATTEAAASREATRAAKRERNQTPTGSRRVSFDMGADESAAVAIEMPRTEGERSEGEEESSLTDELLPRSTMVFPSSPSPTWWDQLRTFLKQQRRQARIMGGNRALMPFIRWSSLRVRPASPLHSLLVLLRIKGVATVAARAARVAICSNCIVELDNGVKMVPFTELQILYFLVFFLISMLFICLMMWLTCMCLDWRRRRGTKSVVTLALAEGELGMAKSRNANSVRDTKEAKRYHDTIVAIAFALYSYVAAVITIVSYQDTNQHHPSLSVFANALHDAAQTLKGVIQNGGGRSSLLDRVMDMDSAPVSLMRTPRPVLPPPAPPINRTPILSDIPSSSVRMTLIDEFTDNEEERPVRGIPALNVRIDCSSSMNIGIAAQVDEEIRSDRYFRIITVSAQVYMLQENSSEWRELSPCPVLVHLYNDGIENVPKLLAEHQKEMIIDCCPLLPSFAVHCPSKKFMHVTSNKYDPHSPVFGFGFSNAFELETLFLHLRRLKASTASSMAAAVAAAGAGYAAHPAAAALLAPPRRTMGSPHLPTTPSRHHLAASATPFSPRFHAAAAYKDSPYHGRHHSHPAALPTAFHPAAAAAAAAAAHLQQHQAHGMHTSGPQAATHGNNGYSFQEFVPRRREMSSLSMDRISCGQPPLNTMMMMNEMRSGVTSINGSVQGDETVDESLQPYFGYGEGDGGFGGLEDAPLGGGYE
ncbi:hypothetical protein PENTCL1PPCAC_5821, partial [Pristionchus entomophagus]